MRDAPAADLSMARPTARFARRTACNARFAARERRRMHARHPRCILAARPRDTRRARLAARPRPVNARRARLRPPRA
ncbi:hypothetical protein AQ874_23045 [Burkholderia pseudomallei]|nr:hypothetical protein AQ874_23045 [Burkholderia pseudomallei]